MKLSSTQKETLHEVATGTPSGQLLKPIPSLIKHGLVTTTVIPGMYHEPTRSWVRNALTVYKLTPLGLEEYTKLRTAMYEAALQRAEEGFKKHLATAAARTVS